MFHQCRGEKPNSRPLRFFIRAAPYRWDLYQEYARERRAAGVRDIEKLVDGSRLLEAR
ncbi:MAG: hypothetical protein WD535_05340 [Thermaerobacterales bacterium]